MSQMKKDCGYAAAQEVKDGQILGLGTGSTTLYFIEKVGMRVRDEGIEVMGIPTSFQSSLLAREWNIPNHHCLLASGIFQSHLLTSMR